MSPTDMRDMTLSLAIGEGPVAALNTMVMATQLFAEGRLPDQTRAREALDAWGITYEPADPLRRMIGSVAMLKLKLPHGWKFSNRCGGGHNELLDARGAARLHWYIHGWDSISVRINRRFKVSGLHDVSAAEGVYHVMDGETVIHVVAVRFPHTRITGKPYSDGTPYYDSGYPGENDGWTQAMCNANSNDLEKTRQIAREWLDENRPGWSNDIESWGL